MIINVISFRAVGYILYNVIIIIIIIIIIRRFADCTAEEYMNYLPLKITIFIRIISHCTVYKNI